MYYTLYGLFILALVIAMYVQIRVSTVYRKYSRVGAVCKRPAYEIARMILDENGLNYVKIEKVKGTLTDHFDPRTNTLRLSENVYSDTSVGSVGVAAHEAGHAIQYKVGYFPVKLRGALVPATSFASRFTWILILIGSLFMAVGGFFDIGYYILLFGIGLFSVTTIFQLVTLPCEFNASKRAMQALRVSGFYSGRELSASRKVLNAAALTYIAGLLVSIIQLLRLLTLLGRRER